MSSPRSIHAVAGALGALLLSLALVDAAKAQDPGVVAPFVRCVPTEGRTITPYPQAKFMEMATGDDVTARYVYGTKRTNSVAFKTEIGSKGAAITAGSEYEKFTSREQGRAVPPRRAFNLYLKVVMKPVTVKKFEQNQDTGKPCGKAEGYAANNFVVKGNPYDPVVARPMSAEQKAKTDCNNEARWKGKRRMVEPGHISGFSSGHTSTFEAGLKIPVFSFTTSTSFGENTMLTYTAGRKYNFYWECGDNPKRGAANEIDLSESTNLFMSPVKGTRKS